MEKTYVGTRNVPPTYSIGFWNVHGGVLAYCPRTHNTAEAYDKRLSVLAECSHLPLYRVLEILHKEKHHVESLITARLSGRKAVSKSFDQVKSDKRILELVSTYSSMVLPDFLTGMALNVSTKLSRYRRNAAEAKENRSKQTIQEHVKLDLLSFCYFLNV